MCLFGMTVRNHGLLSKTPSKTPQQHPLCASLPFASCPMSPLKGHSGKAQTSRVVIVVVLGGLTIEGDIRVMWEQRRQLVQAHQHHKRH